jgi:hypothetical protein
MLSLRYALYRNSVPALYTLCKGNLLQTLHQARRYRIFPSTCVGWVDAVATIHTHTRGHLDEYCLHGDLMQMVVKEVVITSHPYLGIVFLFHIPCTGALSVRWIRFLNLVLNSSYFQPPMFINVYILRYCWRGLFCYTIWRGIIRPM